MRPMRLALLGAISLFALPFLTSCASNGTTPALVTETQLVEAQVLQLTPIEPRLLVIPALAPAPTPAIPSGPNCKRPAGCYSNRQLEAMLAQALSAYQGAADNLHAIDQAQKAAKATNPKPP